MITIQNGGVSIEEISDRKGELIEILKTTSPNTFDYSLDLQFFQFVFRHRLSFCYLFVHE